MSYSKSWDQFRSNLEKFSQKDDPMSLNILSEFLGRSTGTRKALERSERNCFSLQSTIQSYICLWSLIVHASRLPGMTCWFCPAFYVHVDSCFFPEIETNCNFEMGTLWMNSLYRLVIDVHSSIAILVFSVVYNDWKMSNLATRCARSDQTLG